MTMSPAQEMVMSPSSIRQATSSPVCLTLPYLNSPWAVVIAPASGFGGFSGDILVGQFGSGAIVAYTPAGSFVGLMFNPAALQLQINGLWGLGFGNGTGPVPRLRCTSQPGPSTKPMAYWAT